MSVSIDHELMVKFLADWIVRKGSPFEIKEISVESIFHSGKKHPPLIENHRPDIFCELLQKRNFIIADAKTSRDLETMSTRHQLVGFVRWLGRQEKGIIILGVPWDSKASAYSLLKRIIIESGCKNVSPIVKDCSIALLDKHFYENQT